MPKRSRSGVVNSPARVVAPIEGEFGEVDLHRSRRGTRADDEVELEILHRGIKDLLDRRVEAMDLVDEQDVARLEVGQLGGEVAGLGDDRPGGRAEIDAELARDDLGERRLAEAWRADEQHVIERFASRLRRFDEDLQVLARRFLAGEIGQHLRAQGRVILRALLGGDETARRVGHQAAPGFAARAAGGCMVSPNRLAAIAQVKAAIAPLKTKAWVSAPPIPSESAESIQSAVGESKLP